MTKKRDWPNQLIVMGIAACLTLSAAIGSVRASAPRVVVTIKPLHSLVDGMMRDVGTPELIVRGSLSPHLYALRPSDIGMLEKADLVIWVGATMETFLHRHFTHSGYGTNVVSPLKMRGVTLLAKRRGTKWEPDYDEVGRDRMRSDDMNSWVDAHIWLDPHNARAFVEGLEGILARHDPENGQIYARNGKRLRTRLAKLESELKTQLASHRTDVYLVFHDAYQYFERRFGLHPVGSITVHPENPPSARRIVEVRGLVVERGAACVFSEPQFKSGIVERLIHETGARHGLLDPIGADLTPGPDLYFDLLINLARSLSDCL